MPDIHTRIQHHPARAHLIPPLLDALDGLAVEVIAHASDPPNPWHGYKQCLRDAPDCTHLLVLQDDCAPVPNFVPAVQQIAEAQPDTPVCLFLGRLPRDSSAQAARLMRHGGGRYVTLSLRSFLPVVACLWPRHRAAEFLAWADENPGLPGQREPRSDDAVCGRWKSVTRATVLATVPSIVEHPDVEPSTIGRTARWGKDRGRCAAFLATDALDFDW